MATPETPQERLRRRRRFARSLAPLAVLLVVAGFLVASNTSGLLNILGYLALMQGVGLIAAIVPLAFGHNPLSKD
jgi:hypothetical protein